MPHNVKLEAEEKVILVRKFIRGEISCTEAARQADVDFATMETWVRQ